MSELIDLQDMRYGYLKLIQRVIVAGDRCAPRGEGTLELTDVTIELSRPSQSVPVGVGRKLNTDIGAAETMHLIGGVSDAAQILSVSDNFRQFVQADTLPGSYGPRLYGQLPRIVELLATDPDSRQAVATVWNPTRDVLPDIADRPCTVSVQFKVRKGELLLHTIMRSNDAWLGVPYDFWMFTRLQQAVAWTLGRYCGPYTHSAGSLHLYDRDRLKVNDLHAPRSATMPPAVPMFTGEHDPVGPAEALARWSLVQSSCEAAVLGRDQGGMVPWYADVLSEHASDNQMCAKCRYLLPAQKWFIAKHLTCRACERKMTQVEYERSR